MKISAEQKIKTRRAILDAAVDLAIDKGLRSTSMRAIARAAGVGDATIYNYFPNKDALLHGYYMDALESAVNSLERLPDFHEYDIREQQQAFFEGVLERFLPDREFVEQTFSTLFFSPMHMDKGVRAIRKRFIEIIDTQFRTAEDNDELPELDLRGLAYHCIWDYFIAVVLYWLRDDSEQFANTSIFMDKSMDLGHTMLRSGVLQKLTGLASFLFKSHVLSRVDFFMEQRDTFQRMKQEFLDHE